MGIELASSFTRKAAVLLDDLFTVANVTARDAIAAGVRAEGMSTFCVAEQKNYQLQGGIANSNWVELAKAIPSLTITATAAGTTSLTSSSTTTQLFNGTTTQTVTLPVASTLTLNQSFYIINASTGIVTVNSSGANLVKAIPAGGAAVVSCILISGTTAASWFCDYSTGISTAETLTNKTITSPVIVTPLVDIETFTDQGSTPATPAAGKRKFYAKSTGKFYQLNSAGLETEIGSGSGGLKNFVVGGDAETGSIFATYKDAAGALPVDGAGGIPTIASASTTTTNPLSGLTSFTMTHPASNAQGEGWSYDFSIDNAAKAKVLSVSFDYIIESGTFVAGSAGIESDVEVYIYDVTNAQIIQPSSYKLLSSSTTIADKFSATFQTTSSSTSYRLIFHLATANTAAFVLKVDSVAVSPISYVYGAPVTDWRAFTITPSTGTKGSIVTDDAKWRRVGDTMEVRWDYYQNSAGTAGSGNYLLNLPPGLTIDSAKITTSVGSTRNIHVGEGNLTNLVGATGASAANISVNVWSSTQLVVNVDSNSGGDTTVAWGSSAYSLSNTPLVVTLRYAVPILGWSSSVQMSDQTDTRVVTFSGNQNTNTAVTASVTDLPLTTSVDTHGGWGGSAYTVKVPGYYSVLVSSASLANANVYVYVNGAYGFQIGGTNNATALASAGQTDYLKTGDTLSIRYSATTTIYSVSRVSFTRISGPAAIAANASVCARYNSAAGQSIAAGASQIIDFGTKDFDDLGSVTTGAAWKYKAQISGVYRVSTNIRFANSLAWSAGGTVSALLYKNGVSTVSADTLIQATATFGAGPTAVMSTTLRLLADDYIDMRTSHSEASARTLVAAGTLVWISIERVGN